jgi:hypothetical protein
MVEGIPRPARSFVLTPRLRKLLLVAHVTSSVGWLGAVAGFLALAVSGLASQDVQVVRADYLAMELIGWYVIVPLSFAALVIGLVQSLGTEWGLIRHYWVLVKLVLTVACIGFLLLHMQLVTYLSSVAANTPVSSADLRDLRVQLVGDAGAALVVLIVATALSIYKPRGMTRRGRRAQRARRG